jgi:hypothetical protein
MGAATFPGTTWTGAARAAAGGAQPASRQADLQHRRADAVGHDGGRSVETAGRARRGTHPVHWNSTFRKAEGVMGTSIQIESQGEHQYVVRLRDDDEACETWFNITPAVLDQVRVGGEDEERVVRRTAEFLIARQDVADFPDIVELEDVIATYDDFIEFMTR